MSNSHPGVPVALVVFGGLPGTGKTTISREVARRLGGVHLRIDAIEQAIRDAGVLAGGVGPAGYAAAQAVAEGNLRLGRTVVADCVNPVRESREGWRAVAHRAGARIVEIEIVCSDDAEHRRRIEGRTADVDGLALPTWNDVLRHDYRAWDRPPHVIDSARRLPDALVDAALRAVAAVPPARA